MTVIRFHLDSALSQPELMEVLTDFGPTRAEAWPSIDAEHLVVHERGEGWAEVTEGTAAAWERARYAWDDARGRVEISTHESKLFGPGGGWVFQLSPLVAGGVARTRVDVELTRTPSSLKGRMLAALLPLVGPSSLRTSFRGPLQAV